MKTLKITKSVVTLLCVAVIAGFTACTTDTVEYSGGKLPDKDPLENTYGMIRSEHSPISRAVTHLTEGTSISSDRIYCRLTRPAETAVALQARVDEGLVPAYNTRYGTDFKPMPSANVEIAGQGRFTVAPGDKSSEKLAITFKADGLAPGTYLLPVAVKSTDVKFSADNNAVYFGVKVRGVDRIDYELDTDYMTVFYLNTSNYQPLLADIWDLQKDGLSPDFPTSWRRTIGNIINLRTVPLIRDEATGRAMLVLNRDMRYVLDHADKYLRPLQDKGRKVCLCLEGGGSGLGFCNLTDGQIADYVAQVKACVEAFGLDGVNLFDKNAGYDIDGAPAVNTTSYPKLIKAMREALGATKMLTVADYEAPTEYFWDTAATGGIVVGDYLDYAWSGYTSEDEEIQLVDPYIDPEAAMMAGIILRERKAFAGVPKERFGCMNVPFYATTSPFLETGFGCINVGMWAMNPEPVFRNNIVVYADLIPNLQGNYEGSYSFVPGLFWSMYGEDAMMGLYSYAPLVHYNSEQGYVVDMFDDYNAFAKDW